jgi:hypothetical protein
MCLLRTISVLGHSSRRSAVAIAEISRWTNCMRYSWKRNRTQVLRCLLASQVGIMILPCPRMQTNIICFSRELESGFRETECLNMHALKLRKIRPYGGVCNERLAKNLSARKDSRTVSFVRQETAMLSIATPSFRAVTTTTTG